MLVTFSPAYGARAAGLKLDVEKKGTYVYWLAYTDAAGVSQITQPERFKGKSTQIDLGELGANYKNARVFVMDKRTGNLAIADYQPAKDPKSANPIDLKKDDFGYVRSVKLRAVASDGQPIESGIMIITDGDGTEMRSVITPADAGVASFQNVASGEINVKVRAKGATRTLDSDFELPSSRPQPGFERDIKVAGDVDTVSAPAASQSTDKQAAKPAEQRLSTGAALLQFISGLIFLIVAVAVIAIILRAKGVTARNALKKMGVQLPEDQAAQPAAHEAPAVDPNICQFCGQKKDAAGNCACTVSPGASPFAAPAPAAGTGPRLVGTQGMFAGHVFQISGPSATVGREEGNSITLTGDNTASRHHATITVAGSDYTIRDEGSSNGTFVNGARITEQKLSPGDEVQIGASKFRFEA